MKKSYIISFVILISLITLVLNISFYSRNCGGDVCGGPDKLVYIFVQNKLLCNLVSGEYKRHNKSWSNGFTYECEVKNEWMCHFRGGKMVDLSKNRDPNQIFVAPGGTYYCAKEK